MDALSGIKSMSLSVERSHYMQDSVVLARELGIPVEEVCGSMLEFSENNMQIVAASIVRPFVLNFGRYFRFEVSRTRWPTIGEVGSLLGVNFNGYLHPDILKKLSSDYRLRKVACEIESWAQDMLSRVGTLKESDRLKNKAEILEGYRVYLQVYIYKDTPLMMREIVNLRKELADLKVQQCEEEPR